MITAAVYAILTIRDAATLLTLPIRFAIACLVLAGVTYALAALWESKTWPRTPAFARPRSYSTQGRRLREDANARLWVDRKGFLFAERAFFVGTGLPPVRLRQDSVASVVSGQAVTPVRVATGGSRTWWAFEGRYFWENAGYSPQDVLALLRDRERRHERELQRAHTLLNAEASGRQVRHPVTKAMRQAVFQRDGGMCRECGSVFDLQYDHIIPVALGGATTVENLQILCSDCNLDKGASI